MHVQPTIGPALRKRDTFSPEVGERICTRLMGGDSLRAICQVDGMPARATVFAWLKQHPAFQEQYIRARAIQAELLADEILELADDARSSIQRSRLQIDARKWLASKLFPKKYGKRVGVNVTTRPMAATFPETARRAIAN
jgi:hypothetical protein